MTAALKAKYSSKFKNPKDISELQFSEISRALYL